MFLLLEKQICLNPLESGRVVKYKRKNPQTTSFYGLNPLESGRVVKYPIHINSGYRCKGLNPLESGRVVKSY